MIPLLIAGMKEQQQTIEDLKSKLNGNSTTPITTTTSAITLDATMHTVIINSQAGILVTLPAAQSSSGKIYALVNHSSVNSNTHIAYIDFTGLTSAVIPANNVVWLQSDGTGWNRIK